MQNISSYIFFILIFFTITSCNNKENLHDKIEVIKLNDYEIIIDLQSNVLVAPNIIKYDGSLFIYDTGHGKIFEIGDEYKILREFGRVGVGPGEFLKINNIYLTKEYLYIIDIVQLLIHKYNRNGELHSTFDFGKITKRPTVPPTPTNPNMVIANDIDNQPIITLQDDIILSTANEGNADQRIFEFIDWEDGTQLTEMGEIPEGSSFILDNAKLRNEASDKEIPSFYRANSFPVQDRANPDEYFIIYSSLPKLAKYTSNGEKLWEHDIKSTETDKIKIRFFEVMGQMSKASDIRERVDLKFYSSGISNDEGALYLVVNTNPVMIHQFNNTGELVRKYTFTSDDVTPVLDIDFEKNRILAVTEKGEIHAYPFN